jgi:hypothetical protein
MGLLLLIAIHGAAKAADNPDAHRHGRTHVEGFLLGTWQGANHSRVDDQDVHDEGNLELYLLGSLKMGSGSWYMELRGSSTPRKNGVSEFYGSNALVGETINADGKGRIAATQFFYELPVGAGKFRLGMLDPTAVLDANDVADDEYTQFMADAFVNNPSIGFPSYVLAAAYQGAASERLDYKLFAGSSSGLQDPADPTYHNVVDVGGEGKGAFAAGELDWRVQDYSIQAGLWYDSAELERLDAPSDAGSDTAHGYGVYTSIGGPAGPGAWSVRAGVANNTVQAAANFLSFAYELPLQLSAHATTLGVGLARGGDSSDLPFDAAPIYRAEAYWRVHLAGPAYVSLDVQYVQHAGFHANRGGAWLGGIRLGAAF